jgi:hypothetical protein
VPTHEVAISSPVSATYGARPAEFSPPINTTGLTGAIAKATPPDGCNAVTGVSGKIALIDRGTCDFTVKAQNAQTAGATGLIVANNQGGTTTIVMGGTNAALVIPAVMISQNDGTALKALAAPTGTIRAKAVEPLQIDGSLDSNIVYHEYGHGLTWRMIGGMSGPLAGAIGEGAGDGVAMLINGEDKMGVYASSSPNGIRRFPYASYPLTYGGVDGAEVHNDGEIYAAVIWRLIELFGPSRRSDLFDYYVQGMNFTPVDPGLRRHARRHPGGRGGRPDAFGPLHDLVGVRPVRDRRRCQRRDRPGRVGDDHRVVRQARRLPALILSGDAVGHGADRGSRRQSARPCATKCGFSKPGLP